MFNMFKKNECYQCNRGYYKKENKCNKCINGCSYCLNNEKCEYCLSGFELTKEKKCIFTNKLDFNNTLYNIRKQNLIKIDISKESNITINLSELSNFNKYIPNCELYDENKGKCIKCNNYFSLINNKCESNILNKRKLDYCNIPNCISCYYKRIFQFYYYYDEIFCRTCFPGYHIVYTGCVEDCSDFCLLCSVKGICLKCESWTKLIEGKCYNTLCKSLSNNCELCYQGICYKCFGNDNFGPKDVCPSSKNSNNKLVIIFSAIAFFIILLCIFFGCCWKKINICENRNNIMITNRNNNITRYFRNNNTNNNNNNIPNHIIPHQIRVNNINNNIVTSNSNSNRVLSENVLLNVEKEFEKQKQKLEIEYDFCDYCKFNPAKYKSDCGCILCEEHIKQQNNKKNRVCINCAKDASKIEIINECNICLEKKEDLGHFKCGCAFKVCKDCYIKCKKGNIKCPGCRGVI